MILAETP